MPLHRPAVNHQACKAWGLLAAGRAAAASCRAANPVHQPSSAQPQRLGQDAHALSPRDAAPPAQPAPVDPVLKRTRKRNVSNRLHITPELPPEEALRRMRISDANTGKPAWNKGRKHSEETKAKIRAATAAAMQRPDVHAKVIAALEYRNPVSQEDRDKISQKARIKIAEARAIMLPQAQELRDQLRVSEDSDLQTVAESHHVIDDIMALAWCKLRRKEKLVEAAWAHETFMKDLVRRVYAKMKRDERMAARQESKRVMAVATSQLRQLRRAEAKLQLVERALVNLERARPSMEQSQQLERYRTTELEAKELVERCRKQVTELSEALHAVATSSRASRSEGAEGQD
ncbi:hypothetical protein APUTEX25_004349 [Auxenochlorella protothecoides]|uniref:Nuclease associated modular domain-containing protein n=1 Tax=Auxenochlorella protothecoides TaxID=3075 RepID=A0A3M7L1Q4_AUXPR|nr:hypothetical protein APUTEX25_004349 [Auxenochlorella protothecoides]|eukprot:RMZ55925.1 hypothetical protein APUTEX25_004349 [Auxenochlorella protothecoides]